MPFQTIAKPPADAAPAWGLAPRQTRPGIGQIEAEQHWRRGLAHAQAGRWKEAARAYARAVRSHAGEPLY